MKATIAAPKIHTLSVSQMKTFLMCSRKYVFTYIEKAPPEYLSVGDAFGAAWHHAVGHLLARSTVEAAVPTDELADVFRASLDRELKSADVRVLFDDEETDAPALVSKAREMLEALRRDYRRPDRVIGIDEPFLIKLAHPVTGKVLGVPLAGTIDALVERGGKVLAIEVKPSKRKWGADKLARDIEATAHRMAARSLGHADAEVELVVTTRAKNPDVQIERLVRQRRDEREFAELAFDVVRAVEAGVDHRNRGWQCRGCAYAGACAP